MSNTQYFVVRLEDERKDKEVDSLGTRQAAGCTATKKGRAKGRKRRSMAWQGRECRTHKLVPLCVWILPPDSAVHAYDRTHAEHRVSHLVSNEPANHDGRLPLVPANGRVGPRSRCSHMFPSLIIAKYSRRSLHDRDDTRGCRGGGTNIHERERRIGRAKIDGWWGWPWALKLRRATEKSAAATTYAVQPHVAACGCFALGEYITCNDFSWTFVSWYSCWNMYCQCNRGKQRIWRFCSMSVIDILNAVALYEELSIIVVWVNQLFFIKLTFFEQWKRITLWSNVKFKGWYSKDFKYIAKSEFSKASWSIDLHMWVRKIVSFTAKPYIKDENKSSDNRLKLISLIKFK